MNALRTNWRKLRDGAPGRRFEEFHQFCQGRRRGTFFPTKILTVVVGVLLVLGGAAIGWLPGPGGCIAIIGLALLAQEFRPLARLLDRLEPLLRRAWSWLNARRKP